MAEGEASFRYLAFDGSGRKVTGVVAAASDGAAFARLKQDGLSPIRLKAISGSVGGGASANAAARGLNDRDLAAFLADLGALLAAGADMRAALGILGARAGRSTLRTLSRTLSNEISGGGALDDAFSRHLGKTHAFIGALIAAGEAAGNIAAGFQRAAEMLEARIRLRDQLVSVLSYPLFVLLSTVVALAVILLFVVPSLAPLVQDIGAQPPVTLKILIGASDFLQAHLLVLGVGFTTLVVALTVAGTLGFLTTPIERFLLDGPARRTTARLVFGAYAIALGNMLAAGAPMSDALRLSIRSVRSGVARGRLNAVGVAVRQGVALPTALERIAGFPDSIVRLAAVGDVTGALGPMLARAGKLEEEAAIRRIEAIGRLLGPALIIVLGGLIGMLMAGLLSGVSQLGGAALN